MTAGALRETVSFESRGTNVDDFGGQSDNWTAQFNRNVQFLHISGGEAVEAARVAGREMYRVKVRSSAATRAITADGWRLQLSRTSQIFNILSIDAITDRAWVWLRVEA